MRPITPEDGYSQEVVLGSLDEDTRGRVSALLNAGSVLNAVKRDGWDADRYLVRSELFEYLGEVVERELRSNASARGIVAREQEQAARGLVVAATSVAGAERRRVLVLGGAGILGGTMLLSRRVKPARRTLVKAAGAAALLGLVVYASWRS